MPLFAKIGECWLQLVRVPLPRFFFSSFSAYLCNFFTPYKTTNSFSSPEPSAPGPDARGAGLPVRHREPALHSQAPLRRHKPGHQHSTTKRPAAIWTNFDRRGRAGRDRGDGGAQRRADRSCLAAPGLQQSERRGGAGGAVGRRRAAQQLPAVRCFNMAIEPNIGGQNNGEVIFGNDFVNLSDRALKENV